MKKRHLAVSMVAAFVLFFAAFGLPAAAQAAKTGGTLTFAQDNPPGNMNPLIYATTNDENVTNMIFNWLIKPDAKLAMVPNLATDWTVSADGKTYTFNLQKKVKWHDGEAFTAKDVAFTFTSLADKRYDGGSYSRVQPILGAVEFHEGKAATVEGIKVINDYKISFTLKEPNAAFLANLYLGIIPEHVLKDVSPAEWIKHPSNRNPIGTGPFKFVKSVEGQYMELEANKDYFEGAPKLDKVIVRFGDQNTMLAAFMNQEIDITLVPIAEVGNIKSLKFAEIKTSADLSVYYIGFNLRNEHFKDVRVRQAIAHATNKDLIVKTILGEYGSVANDVFPDAHWSHNPKITTFPYDKAKAKKLLEAAGYKLNSANMYAKDGKVLSFTLEVPTGKKEREKTAVMLKQQLEEVGIQCDLLLLDFPTLVTKLLPKDKEGKKRAVTAEDFNAYILGYGVEADPDEYRPYFHTAYMPPNGYNFCGYSTPQMDALFQKQLLQTKASDRTATFYEIGKRISDDQPWVPIYSVKGVYGMNKKVQGFSPDFRGISFNAREWSKSAK